MNTTCICCGQKFPDLGGLIDHMRQNHTEEEVVKALTQTNIWQEQKLKTR